MVLLSCTTAKAITEVMSTLQSKTNKIKFLIGMKDLGEGNKSCVAQLVHETQMVSYAFAAKMDEESFTVACNANQLLTALSAMTAYNADIEVEKSDATLTLCVGKTRLSVPIVNEEECEPAIASDHKKELNIVVGEIPSKELISVLKKGSSFAGEADKFMASQIEFSASAIAVNSTSGSAFVRSTIAAKLGIEKTITAAAFLSESLTKADEPEREKIWEQITAAKATGNTEEVIKVAVAHGFDINKPYTTFLSEKACANICKLASVSDKVQIMVSDKYFFIYAGNTIYVTVTAAKSAVIWEMFSKIFEAPTTGKITVDKDELNKGLKLVSLNEDTNKPSFDIVFNSGLELKNGKGNQVFVPVVESEGTKQFEMSFATPLLTKVIESFDAGNISFRHNDESQTGRGLIVENASTKAFICRVNKPKATVKKADEGKADAEAKETAE